MMERKVKISCSDPATATLGSHDQVHFGSGNSVGASSGK